MPRKSNQTQYDNMMSVFRQNDQRSSQRRDTNHPSQAPAARSRTPHPTQIPASTPTAYNYPVQSQAPTSSGGAVSPTGWEEELLNPTTGYPVSNVQNTPYSGNVYENAPYAQAGTVMNPATSSHAYTTPNHWVVHFNFGGGREHRQSIPMQTYQVPELQCRCGIHIRIVHLPTLVNWTPPFGVLWNFKLETSNGWFEGRSTETCVSVAKCPRCNAVITLRRPAGSSAA